MADSGDPLTLADVRRVAALARLALTPDEEAAFLPQLNEVLDYAKQIQALDTSGVEPTAHVVSRAPLDRPDDPRPSLPLDDVMRHAPDASVETRLFAVPRVIGPSA